MVNHLICRKMLWLWVSLVAIQPIEILSEVSDVFDLRDISNDPGDEHQLLQSVTFYIPPVYTCRKTDPSRDCGKARLKY